MSVGIKWRRKIQHGAESLRQTCLRPASDSGEYHCAATPWYLSASTGAWTEGGELSSTRIFLTVRFAGEQPRGLAVVQILVAGEAF